MTRVRFAPSPTGMFHVGSARTVLFNWILAKQSGGTFVLRIEDTDDARNRPEWTQGILDAMEWLGISAADEAFEGPYFQSHNAEAHVEFALRLAADGKAYYCDCTRDAVVARTGNENLPYDQHCRDRDLERGPGRALRFRVPAGQTVVTDLIRGTVEFDNAAIEDFVVLRGNGTPLFLVANVVDDVLHRVDLVVRGEEHFPNTPKQQMLWDALGHTPPTWAHLPVLVNEARKKLSKRRDKVALEQFRDEGFVMDAMRNYLMTLGWMPPDGVEIATFASMIATFSLADVVPSPAFFDIKKLTAFNKEYIRAMTPAEFFAAATPWVTAWQQSHPGHRWNDAIFLAMAPVVQQRCETLADAPGVVDFLMLDAPQYDAGSVAGVLTAEGRAMLADADDAFAEVEWEVESLKACVEAIGEARGVKKNKAQGPVRVAVTGRTAGPPLYEALVVLGRDETLRRLAALAATPDPELPVA